MKVTGVLSISNGAGLEYPYPVVVHSLQRLCDNVVVGVDPQFPADRKLLEGFSLEGVHIVDAPWDRTNRNGGTEIAIQMDRLVQLAKTQGSDWVVVMQADELFHDDDFGMLRSFMERAPSTTTGFSTERVYFWKDLQTVRTDWNAHLVRVFRPRHYSFMAEGTSKDGMYSGPLSPGVAVELPYKIYHYSRVDLDPVLISRRVRNLDTFFHPEETLVPAVELTEYDFTPREHDNFSIVETPKKVTAVFENYTGTHPFGVKEWYSG
jgi:hypothetical protein